MDSIKTCNARSGQVITWEKLREFLPAETECFSGELENMLEDVDSFCRRESADDWYKAEDWSGDAEFSESLRRANKAWNILQSSFRDKTSVGNSFLEIFPAFYDRESNDGADELDGGFFWVTGAVQKTPAGERFQAIWDKVNFVNWN